MPQPADREDASEHPARLPLGTAALVIVAASALAWFGIIAALRSAGR